MYVREVTLLHFTIIHLLYSDYLLAFLLRMLLRCRRHIQVEEAGKDFLSKLPNSKKRALGKTSVARIKSIITKKLLKWRKAQGTTAARDEAKKNARNFASLAAVLLHTFEDADPEHPFTSSSLFNMDATGIVFNKHVDVDEAALIGILNEGV
jgi:hypothetical protein